MNTILLTIGDWSDDGHGKTAQVQVRSNKTAGELDTAWEASCKLTGVDFSNDIASDYEDSGIEEDVVEKLKEHGFDPEELGIDQPSDDLYSLDWDSFARLWCWFVSLSLSPDDTLEVIEGEEEIPELQIGGYGLFFG